MNLQKECKWKIGETFSSCWVLLMKHFVSEFYFLHFFFLLLVIKVDSFLLWVLVIQFCDDEYIFKRKEGIVIKKDDSVADFALLAWT